MNRKVFLIGLLIVLFLTTSQRSPVDLRDSTAKSSLIIIIECECSCDTLPESNPKLDSIVI